MNAVEVRDGCKYLGNCWKPKIVLNHMNVKVEYGSIYGLLGPSGCGKTILLSCIVGVRSLSSGSITVLGTSAGKPGSGVPGPRIGYMPQDIALVDQFSVRETIFFFGRICGMTEDRIQGRFVLLQQLLELPDENECVINLSGGQKRRVSIAAAMVHEPELLILDEPTVGLDAILRKKIWNFLIEATRSSKLAVIITTHYIEEANSANTVGIMRNGTLLAEDSPANILRQLNKSSLEDAFLALCISGGTSKKADEVLPGSRSFLKYSKLPNEHAEDREMYNKEAFQPSLTMKSQGQCQITTIKRMKALLTKNILQLLRSPGAIIFCFLFPILQLSCFNFAIGGNPRNLKIGIVNEEMKFKECHNNSLITPRPLQYTCDLFKISCLFIEKIDDDLAEKVYYNSSAEAYVAARKGFIMSYVHFGSNFTESMSDVLNNGYNAANSSIIGKVIKIHMDMTSQQIGHFVGQKLKDSFKSFTETLMGGCDLPPRLGNIPMRFFDPIYGSFNANYKEFIAPGFLMSVIFFMAAVGTSTVFITDKQDGVWDRTLISGITHTELVMSHVSLQSVLVLIQILEMVCYSVYLYDGANHGDVITELSLCILLGVCGMLFGLSISVFCSSHIAATLLVTATFYTPMIFSGIFWPAEAMPVALQIFANIFIFSIPSKSLRFIVSRGWPITHPEVAKGFLVLAGWIFCLFVLCIIGLRMKR